MSEAPTETADAARPRGEEDLLRAEQVAALYRNGPVGIAFTLVALALLVGVLVRQGELSPRVGLTFIGAVIFNAALRAG